MKHWIFLITEYNDYNLGSLDQIIERIRNEKTWKIGYVTRNRLSIDVGDQVLFYLTGKGNQHFIASAFLNSKFQNIGEKMWGIVQIGEFNEFENPVPIRLLLNRLEFIKNKDFWWSHLQGGITYITPSDFSLICRKGTRRGLMRSN